MSDEFQEHQKLMSRHAARRVVDFVPYWCRPSEGTAFRSTDPTTGAVTLQLEVAGCGTLFLRADGIGPGNEAFCGITEDSSV